MSQDRNTGVDRDGADAVTDGGNTASPFDVVSEIEETRKEKYEKLYDTYVRAPVAIIWQDWRARVGFFVLACYLLMGLFGPMVVGRTHVTDGTAFVQPFDSEYTHHPFGIGGFSLGGWTYTGIWEFPLGTDRMGRDIFARIVYSTPTVLKMILAGGISTVTFGMVVGTIAGYKGGRVDSVLSSITDVFINLPEYPLIIVLSLTLPIGGNPWAVGVLIAVTEWGALARKMRSQVLALREESFVEASRAAGISSYKIILKDVTPHLMPYAMINLANAARKIIFTAAALFFLGVLTLPSGQPTWGVMLNQAYESGAYYRPGQLHWFLAPALTIILLGFSLILLSQSLDRVFNPQVRARHEDQARGPQSTDGEKSADSEQDNQSPTEGL